MKYSVNLLVTTSILLLISIHSFSQIGVGSKFVGLKTHKIDPIKLRQFKNSTLVYIYRKNDSLQELERVFREAWKFTKFRLMSYEEFQNTEFDSTYSFLTIQPEQIRIETKAEGYTAVSSWAYVYLHLYMVEFDKKGEKEKVNLARIELYPEHAITQAISGNRTMFVNIPDRKKEEEILKREKKMMKHFYSSARLYNLNISFLANYLKTINKLFEENQTRVLYKTDVDTSEIQKLITNTLYIPDYVLTYVDKKHQYEELKLDFNELMKLYPYKHELVSEEALEEKILHSEEPVYYFLYVRSGTNKYINIVNSKTGNIIYCLYQEMSNRLKPMDIETLGLTINRKKMPKRFIDR